MKENIYKGKTISQLLKMAGRYIKKKETGKAISIANYFLDNHKLYPAGDIFEKIRLSDKH